MTRPSNDNNPVSLVRVPFGEAAIMMLVFALVCVLLAGGGW